MEAPVITLDDSDEEQEPAIVHRPRRISSTEAEKIKINAKRSIAKRRASLQELLKRRRKESIKNEDSPVIMQHFKKIKRNESLKRKTVNHKKTENGPHTDIDVTVGDISISCVSSREVHPASKLICDESRTLRKDLSLHHKQQLQKPLLNRYSSSDCYNTSCDSTETVLSTRTSCASAAVSPLSVPIELLPYSLVIERVSDKQQEVSSPKSPLQSSSNFQSDSPSIMHQLNGLFTSPDKQNQSISKPLHRDNELNEPSRSTHTSGFLTSKKEQKTDYSFDSTVHLKAIDSTTDVVSDEISIISEQCSAENVSYKGRSSISNKVRTFSASRGLSSEIALVSSVSVKQQEVSSSKSPLQSSANLQSDSPETCKRRIVNNVFSSSSSKNDLFKSPVRETGQFNGVFISPDKLNQSNGKPLNRGNKPNGSFSSPGSSIHSDGFMSPKKLQKMSSPKSPKGQRKTSSPKSPKGQRKTSSPKSPKGQRNTNSPKSPRTHKLLNSSSPFKHWMSSSQPSLLGRKDIWAGSDTKKKLDFGGEERTDFPSIPDESLEPQNAGGNYLVRYFTVLLGEVLNDESAKNFITEGELNLIKTFLAMENEVKEFFLRMYMRKFKWHRVVDINYKEKFNLDTEHCIQILAHHGLLVTDNSALDLEALLEMMKAPEVKELSKSLGLKPHGCKAKLCEDIIKYSKSQKALSFQFGIEMMSSKNRLKEKIRKTVGPCFTLNTEVRKLFRRLELCLRMMFSQEEQLTSGNSVISQLYLFATDNVYPSYHIDRTIEVFSCREDLLRFEEAVELESALSAAAEQKLWDAAEEIISKIRTNFVAELSSETSCSKASELPLSLRRFSAGSSLAYSLHLGLEVLAKLDKHSEAISDLYLLLGQQIYLPYYRGRWYNQLADFLNKCERFKEVAEVLVKGVVDKFTEDKHIYDLQCCCKKLTRRKKVPEEVKALVRIIPLPELRQPPVESIKAKALEGVVGRKKVYVLDDLETQGRTYSSVEEVAINYFKSRGYAKGFHTENSVSVALFGILMWDIIYECPVPYVFRTPYQTKPLDLDSGEFYMNRMSSIDQKFRSMENWSENEINFWIREIYNSHKGKCCIVNWSLFETSNDVLELVHCMGWKIALKICERLAKHYISARSGFPDLVLWTPEENKLLFVEVKSQNDRLSTSQRLWLHYLLEIGADAKLCFVTTVGGRPLKRKSQPGDLQQARSGAVNEEGSCGGVGAGVDGAHENDNI